MILEFLLAAQTACLAPGVHVVRAGTTYEAARVDEVHPMYQIHLAKDSRDSYNTGGWLLVPDDYFDRKPRVRWTDYEELEVEDLKCPLHRFTLRWHIR